MDFSQLKTVNKVYPLFIEQYHDCVMDDSLSQIEKLNSMVQYLNKVGKLTNDIVSDWNKVMAWFMEDGVIDAVITLVDIEQITQDVKDAVIGEISISQLETEVDTLKTDVIELDTAIDNVFNGYVESISNLTGTTLNLNTDSFNVFKATLTGNSNVSFTVTEEGCKTITLFLTQGATAYTVNFPASVKWNGGTVPDMTEVNKDYVLTFVTLDSGTTWLGSLAGVY